MSGEKERATGKMALILWCREMVGEVAEVVDFCESWQSGLAFLQILAEHSDFQPEEQSFYASAPTLDSSPASRMRILNFAFDLARRLGVPAFLSVDDMLDKRLVFSWIANLFHFFNAEPQGSLLVLRQSPTRKDGRQECFWRKEFVRFVKTKCALGFSCHNVYDPKHKFASDNLTWVDLNMARIARISYWELYKEAKNSDLNSVEVPILAIYANNTEPIFCTADTAEEIDAWYNFFVGRATPNIMFNVVSPTASTALMEPAFEGYLMKKGDVGMNKSWKKRYFVLKDSRLRYAQKPFPVVDNLIPTETTCDMTYSLRLCIDVTPQPQIHPFCFTVNFYGRSIVLRADSQTAMETWIDFIRRSREYFIRQTSQVVAPRTKEGLVRIESSDIASGFHYAALRNQVLFISQKENPTNFVAKIPLFECDIALTELANTSKKTVRITINGKDVKTKQYFLSCASSEDTTDWYDALCKHKAIMDVLVKEAAWDAPEEDDDEEGDGEA